MRITRRLFLKAAAVASSIGVINPLSILSAETAQEIPINIKSSGLTPFGGWKADIRLTPQLWKPGDKLDIEVSLQLDPSLLKNLSDTGMSITSLLMLVTSERCFDPTGRLRLPSDEGMSTLLTPTGLAIEGGSAHAISRHAGSLYRNPVDELVKVPTDKVLGSEGGMTVLFRSQPRLPSDTPPGIYRLRFDFGVFADGSMLSLNGNEEDLGKRSLVPEKYSSLAFSPPILCNGTDVKGRAVDAKRIRPRLYWVLLHQYNSNGYRGVVADEDADRFALSSRNIIHDEVILPLNGNRGEKISYNIEPTFVADTKGRDIQRNMPWDYASGELSITITDPSGRTTDLGKAPFKGKSGQRATTNDPRFTAWTPSGYGRYTITAKGWMNDIWGNRFEGGGTYRFWIAKRMTMATATFQGMPYPVGTKYGRDISFFPSVPAEVEVAVSLHPFSDSSKATSLQYGGKASTTGIFGIGQGMQPFVLDKPGEYHARILATYTDDHGHLWICSMRHAGVAYPDNSRIEAHGKKIAIDDQLVDRGESRREGNFGSNDNNRHQERINFPYNGGDVLLIASEGGGANKVVPVLTYESRDDKQPYDPRLRDLMASNLEIKTSNGMSPHLYPEYITDWEYYYAAAPRPGFSSRFVVGENGVRGTYWPTSATNFGGQVGASQNGDLPGDIYRLIGGVVIRRPGQQPSYAGYLASAFIVPGGTNNNRIIAPGSEDLFGADGRKARFFLTAARPGLVYEQNSMFVPVVQIDPILPARISYVLRYPDGTEKVTEGTGDGFGHFISSERWRLDQAGVYQYRLSAEWQGHKGHMPGLPSEGGFLFVRDANASNQPGLRLELKEQQTFEVATGMKIAGFSSAKEVYFTALTPGALIDQGRIPVKEGKFSYQLDPVSINRRIPIYDIENRRNRGKEIGKIIHLAFFSLEKTAEGKPFYSFTRVIVRGNMVLYTR